ncbi:MAG: DUF1842 domain-containing protein [Terracidiphilus sp.]|jgi:hypothetical protein
MANDVKNAALVVGNVGLPGAPIVHLTLAISDSGTVGGMAKITQAIAPPNDSHTFPVTGKCYHTGLGKDTLLIALEGEFITCFPPPAIGCFLTQFHASLAVNPGTFIGEGGFSYANTHVENAPVKPE